MDHQRIAELAGKFLAGTATEAEQAELHAWYDNVSTSGELPGDAATVRRRMLEQVQQRTRPVRRIWPRRFAAAAVLAGICAAGWFLLRSTPSPDATIIAGMTADVRPGGDKATLTLADGTVIELDTARNGALAAQGGATVAKAAGTELVYEDEAAADGPPVYNTIATPRGGQFQVRLPDGSRVWLNAASQLRFPASFRGAERRVELRGEAFFDIQGDAAHPFIVAMPDMEVAVLGTQFNVSAYESEKQKTVLLQGAVRLQSPQHAVTLKPGQSAQWDRGSRMTVENDPYAEDAAAWKDGMFIFTKAPLAEIMMQLSRWYNIEARYETETLKGVVFTGQISRGENLSEVLKMLEMTGTIHFHTENRIVTARP